MKAEKLERSLSQGLEDDKKCSSFPGRGEEGRVRQGTATASSLCGGVRGSVPGSWSPAGTGERGLRCQRGAGKGPHPDKGRPPRRLRERPAPWWRAAPLQLASESSLCFLRQLEPGLARDSGSPTLGEGRHRPRCQGGAWEPEPNPSARTES